MSFKQASIEFDDKGIISLTGFSDSGKSAFLRAIEVCLDNYRPNKQAKFIRDGADHFRIAVLFDDEVEIVKYKYIGGQSSYEMFKDGEQVFTTKVNNAFTPIKDVPAELQKYINLARLESGVLNFRRREDKLFLSETTGSENFADVNKLFGVEEILGAIALVKDDISEDATNLNNLKVEETMIKEEITGLQYITQDLLDKLVSMDNDANLLEKSVMGSADVISSFVKYDKLKVFPQLDDIKGIPDGVLSIINSQEKYNTILNRVNLSELPLIDGNTVQLLSSIENNSSRANSLLFGSTLDFVDVGAVGMLDGVLSANWGKILAHTGVSLDVVDGFEALGTLGSLIGKEQELSELDGKLGKLKDAIAKGNDYLKGVKDQLQAKGLNIHICSHCGEVEIIGQGGATHEH